MGRTIEGNFAAELARQRGEKRYFTGKPCKSGHIAERLVSNSTCVECANARATANPGWFAKYDAKRKERRDTDPEFGAHRRAQRAAAERNRRARADKGIRAAERRARQAAQLQRTPKWADLNAIRRVYKLAAKITRETGVIHHVDHELPLLGELVSGLHVTENLRVIPATANLSKGSKYNP